MPTSLLELLVNLPGKQQREALMFLEEYPELTNKLENLLVERSKAIEKGDWEAVEKNVQAGHEFVLKLLNENKIKPSL